MKFNITTFADTLQIADWTLSDPYHRENLLPSWWLTGEGYLAYRLDDEWSTLCYVRLDEEPEYFRLNVQFAPHHLVSTSRIIKGMLFAIPQMAELARIAGKIGLITHSVSLNLIRFLQSQGFESVGNDDYMQPVVRKIAEESEDAVQVK